jgi:hypothetical protein
LPELQSQRVDNNEEVEVDEKAQNGDDTQLPETVDAAEGHEGEEDHRWLAEQLTSL